MSPRQRPVWPFTRSEVTQPPAEFSRLSVEDPVLKVETGTEDPVWLLTRHEDIRAVTSDPRFKPRMPVGALDRAGPSTIPSTRTPGPHQAAETGLPGGLSAVPLAW